MHRYLLVSATLLLVVAQKGFAVSFSAGTITLDNSTTSKTICYGESSGVISHSGVKIDGGFCEVIQDYKTAVDKWQISYDGASFMDYSLPSENTIPNLERTVWLRKFIKVTGAYVTCGGLGFAFSKEGYTNTVKITVDPQIQAGSISGNELICYGFQPNPIINLAAASGGRGTFSYIWEISNDAESWEIIGGATFTNYTPSMLVETSFFRRIASNTCGASTTDYITKTIREELSPGTITGNQTICYKEQPGILSGSVPDGATGSFAYQWQISANGEKWYDIATATSSFYSPPALSKERYYRREVTSGSCGTKYSNVVFIDVLPELSAGTIEGNQTIFYNSKPEKLNSINGASGGNGAYSYQWQKSLNNTDFIDIAGATLITYQPPALTQSTYFRRKVSDSKGCGMAYSNAITVQVYDDLNAGIIGNEQYICYNASPDPLTGEFPSGGNGNYTYQWQMSLNGNNWNDAIGGTSQNYFPGALTHTTFYRRAVQSPPDNKTKYSNEIIIHVHPELTPGVIGSNQTICYDAEPQTLMGSDPGGGTGEYTFQWYSSKDQAAWEPEILATSELYGPEKLQENTWFRREVISGECGSNLSNAVLINVRDPLHAGMIGNAQTICYNTSPKTLSGETPKGGSGSYNYSWQKSLNGLEFEDIPLASSSQYTPEELIGSTYFRRVVSSGDCGTVFSEPVLISVYDRLESGQIFQDQRICYDSLPEMFTGDFPSGGTGNYSYKWQRSENGLSWQDIFLADSWYYQEENSLTLKTYYKRITLSEQCGSVESNVVTVDMLDKMTPPVIDIQKAYCPGDDVHLEIKNLNPDFDYIWNFEGTGNSFSELTLVDIQEKVEFSVQAVYEGLCKSNESRYTILIDPIKADFKTSTQEVIEGSGVLFENLSSYAQSYLWNFNGEGTSSREEPWFYFYGEGLKTVSLEVTSENGCRDTLTRENYIIVDAYSNGITNQSIPELQDVLVYPNPTECNLNILLPRQNENVEISIFNNSGILLQLKSIKREDHLQLDLTNLPTGSYFLQIETDDTIITEKIIKQ